MNLLLDTQALLWYLRDDPNLSPVARVAIEDPGNLKFVSLVSGWEIAIKNALGKLGLPLPFKELFPGHIEDQGFQLLLIQPRHLHQLLDLPRHHGDPFDRLLIAQALSEDFSVVSIDAAFDPYGVRRIW
jgi:PIN domain nuclease of toxin-antitoxin system